MELFGKTRNLHGGQGAQREIVKLFFYGGMSFFLIGEDCKELGTVRHYSRLY